MNDAKFVRELLTRFPKLRLEETWSVDDLAGLLEFLQRAAPQLRAPIPEGEMSLHVDEPVLVGVDRFVDGVFRTVQLPHRKLQCPKCSGTEMYYETAVTESNRVVGIHQESSTLLVDFHENTGDDDGEDNLVCDGCGHAYVPTDEFVVESMT